MCILISYLAIYQVFLIFFLFIGLLACSGIVAGTFVMKNGTLMNFLVIVLMIEVLLLHILSFKIVNSLFEKFGKFAKKWYK